MINQLLGEAKKWRTGYKSAIDVEIENPELKENTECMVSIMSEEGAKEREIQISSHVYPALMSHNFISIQPYGFNIAGHGNKNFYEANQVYLSPPETINLCKFSTRFADFDNTEYFISEVAVKSAMEWDQCIIEKLEQVAGVGGYVFSMWSEKIANKIWSLKDKIEDNSGLPVNWVIINQRVIPSIEQDLSHTEERKYVSGTRIGRWRDADVYSVDRLPRDTVAIMGYKGNCFHDGTIVLGIKKVIDLQETERSTFVNGSFAVVDGWNGCSGAIGKLQYD